MKKSVLSSASVVLFGAAVAAVLVFSTGCEWESGGSEGTWSDSMSWVNFGGLYRSGSGSRPLVSNFSLTSGGTGDTGDDPDDTSEFTETSVSDDNVFTQNGLITTIGATIDYAGRGTSGWSLKEGSVNIRLVASNGAVGNFADNGGGGLTGSFAQAPGGETFTGTGSVDYDTGAWSLALEVPFLGPANVSYDYTILSPNDGSAVVVDDDDEDPPTSGDWVYTLQVAQTGNRLSFTDNRGFVWEGVLSSVTTPGGDDSGRSPGDVVGTFEVKGVTDKRFRITGTFSGSYRVVAPEDGITYGQLTLRRIQGIWIEPTGNGDLYGETSDAEQTAVDTTTE